jgi:hypothetical protein
LIRIDAFKEAEHERNTPRQVRLAQPSHTHAGTVGATMRALRVGLVALAGTTAVVVVRRRLRDRGRGEGRPAAARSGWLAVTVNRGVDDVLASGRIPAPLASFGAAVEVEARPAPGDKGSELRARFRSGHAGGAGAEERGRLRAALRAAKQQIEVGEVLRVDPTPHGRRTATPTGLLVDIASARSNEGGLL